MADAAVALTGVGAAGPALDAARASRMADRTLLAEVSSAMRMYGVTYRVLEVLRMLAHTRGDGGLNFRAVFREVSVALCAGAETDFGLIAPVTVADAAGRFAPAVFLVRVPVDDPDALVAAVARGLAPLHVLSDDEELVALPSVLRRPNEADALHVRVRAPYPLLVYVGADAMRHALAGNVVSDSLFTYDDPGRAFVRYNRVAASGLVFTVMPRADAPLRRLYVHCVESETLTCAVPTHVASSRTDDFERAMAPFSLESDAHAHPTDTLVYVEWDGAVARRFGRRTVLNDENEAMSAAFAAQSRFFEVLHAALSLNAVGGGDAAWVDVSVVEGGGLDVTVNVTARLYGPAGDARTLGRHVLAALTSASPARAAVDDAYLAGVVCRPPGGWVAASEDVVLRIAEDASSSRSQTAAQPPGMSAARALRPHQLRSLAFMQDAEDAPPLLVRLSDARLPSVEGDWLPHARGLTPHGGYGNYGFHAPSTLVARFPALRRGGIVANRAGTGKTLIALALIVSRPAAPPPPAPPAPAPAPADAEDAEDAEPPAEAQQARATLVLCPTSIVTQWVAEATRACPALAVECLRAGVWSPIERLARDADVVVCGFPMMFNRRFAALKAVRWHRIVLDEAHLARNHVSPLSELQADRVWCMTGTPMGAGATPRELDALLRLTTGVGAAPGLTFAPPSTMRSYRVMNLLNTHGVAPLFDLVGRAMVRLEPLAQAHTASIESDAVAWLSLPAAARAAYDRIEAESRADVMNLARRTQVALARPLQRLRDWCAGASAIHARFHGAAAAPGDAAVESAGVPYDATVHGVGYNDPDTDVCTVCLEPLMYARLAMPPCRHWFCLPCISVALARAPRCPTCRKLASAASLRVQPPATEPEPEPSSEPSASPSADDVEDAPPPPDAVFEAKIAGLVALADASEGEKLIVFTRHTPLARRYAEGLSAWGVPAVHYTRSLPERERNANKARFVAEPELRVIVLDLDNAEGIDGLQVAHRVVFCEPFPATDGNQRTQAVSRCDRLGQSRPVIVRTLAFSDTVEARLATYAPHRATPPIRRVRHYVGLE